MNTNVKFQNLKILRDKEVVCGMGQEVDTNMANLLVSIDQQLCTQILCCARMLG